MSDLQELFNRDPDKLSEQDIDQIIIKLREARQKFNIGDKTAGKVKKEKENKTINLEDLGL